MEVWKFYKIINKLLTQERSSQKKIFLPNCVTIFSARSWLNDTKRKYEFYDLIKINQLTDHKIALETLKYLDSAK